ncbi:MAG TPA: metal-dependent hydrolase, partial [Nitrospira sp.]|nr:metal-dependent hydrolase [Nitrospira sp.]
MAHGHTTFNFALGLSFGNALSLPPGVTLVGATCLAGAGTLCDIDCKGSTVSTAFGPFSEVAYHGAVHLHHMVSAAMYSDHDFEAERTEHRGLTHWWPFWLAVGAGVWAGCAFVGQWFAMSVIAVLFALAARGLT